MLKIKFKYRDNLSNGKWNEQECCVSSVDECIKLYGLGVDCEYEILSVKDNIPSEIECDIYDIIPSDILNDYVMEYLNIKYGKGTYNFSAGCSIVIGDIEKE